MADANAADDGQQELIDGGTGGDGDGGDTADDTQEQLREAKARAQRAENRAKRLDREMRKLKALADGESSDDSDDADGISAKAPPTLEELQKQNADLVKQLKRDQAKARRLEEDLGSASRHNDTLRQQVLLSRVSEATGVSNRTTLRALMREARDAELVSEDLDDYASDDALADLVDRYAEAARTMSPELFQTTRDSAGGRRGQAGVTKRGKSDGDAPDASGDEAEIANGMAKLKRAMGHTARD